MEVALKKFLLSSGDLAESRFSNPEGNPASTEGKGTVFTSILVENWGEFLSGLVKKAALRGVVMIAVATPCAAKTLAMSKVGIIWP